MAAQYEHDGQPAPIQGKNLRPQTALPLPKMFLPIGARIEDVDDIQKFEDEGIIRSNYPSQPSGKAGRGRAASVSAKEAKWWVPDVHKHTSPAALCRAPRPACNNQFNSGAGL